MKEIVLQLKKAVMDILKEKQALGELPFLIKELAKENEKLKMSFEELSSEVTIITAQTLSNQNKKILEEALAAKLKKEIYFYYQIDQNLKGGIMIKINDKLYDYSFKGGLEDLEKILT